MPELLFDAATHTYTLDGAVVPSVTDVLKEAGLLDNTWSNEEARERGTAVHEACLYFDQDDLDEESVAREYTGYVRAYAKFRAESGFAPELMEYQVHCEKFRYAGTLDRVGLIGKRKVLVDLKTCNGAVPLSTRWQTAAYANCLPHAATLERLAVALRADGSYQLTQYGVREYPQDLNVFLAALTVVHTKRSMR